MPCVAFFLPVLCGAVVCCAGVPALCCPAPCSSAFLALVGAWCCWLFWGVCWRVCLPGVVFWWHVLALVSLSGRMAGCPVVGCFCVVCCGFLLPGAVCCGAVPPYGVAVLLPLWLVFVFVQNFLLLKTKLDTHPTHTRRQAARPLPNICLTWQAGSKTTSKYLSYMLPADLNGVAVL